MENVGIAKELINNKNMIIPVIGNDMIVFKKQNGNKTEEIPFQQHIVETFAKDYREFGEKKFEAMSSQNYYCLSVLAKNDKEFLETYRTHVIEGISNGSIRLKSSVVRFLETFKFPVIITTICFNIIEQELNKKQLYYFTKKYMPQSPNDELDNRCVYHVFGSVEDGQEWVYNEKKLVFFLKSLNDVNHGAKNLVDYIKNRNYRLLVLGCELPNWLFRFMLYPIELQASDCRQGYWFNDKEPESSLDSYLEEINYKPAKDIDDIINEASRLYSNNLDDDLFMHQNNHKDHFDVFISYASEDKLIVYEIYNILHNNHGLSVWIDKKGKSEIGPGDPYWENIQDGIKKSDHYMPIVTGNFIKKYCNYSSSLRKETDMFLDYYIKKEKANLKRNYSIPVIIKGELWAGKEIDGALVENISKYGLLPAEFFNEINNIVYDKSNPKEFNNIDWKKTV